MRRLIAFILILLLPIQPAWSLAQTYSHLDAAFVTVGFHEHHDHGDHEVHDHTADLPDSGAAVADAQQKHQADGHHDGHYHLVFHMLVISTSVLPADSTPHAAPFRPPSPFSSHIPLLLDWPPARA